MPSSTFLKMDDEEEKINLLTEHLVEQMENDLVVGIDACEELIKGKKNSDIPFYDYLEILQKQLKKSSCTSSWTSNTLSVRCETCSNCKNSCICIKCFLNGNHEGHDVSLHYFLDGNCDCGDPSMFNPSGYCSNHSNPDSHPERTQIDKETRIALIAISRAFLSHLLFYTNFEPMSFQLIIKWLQRLIFLGDAPRRCVAIAWSQTIDFYDFYQQCLHLNHNDTDILVSFLYSLTSDKVFKTCITKCFVKNLDHFIWVNSRLSILYPNKNKKDESPIYPAAELFRFSYQACFEPFISKVIKKQLCDWVNPAIKSIKMLYNFNLISKGSKYFRLFNFIKYAESNLVHIIQTGISDKGTALNFVDEFATFCQSCELTFPAYRQFGDKIDDPKKTQKNVSFHFFYFYKYIYFISQERIVSETPLLFIQSFFSDFFSNPKKEVIIEQNNVSGSFYEHSVLSKDVAIFQTLPLHLLAFVCLDLKTHTFKEVISNITDDSNTFLKKWLIFPLRLLVASELSRFDLFVRNTTGFIAALTSFKNQKNIVYKFIPTFKLIQQIFFNLDEEEFLTILLSVYGVFLHQKESSETQMQSAFFSLIYLIICLIFDNLCMNNDFFAMRRLAVMANLKLSPLSNAEFNDIWFGNYMKNSKFMEDLLSFSTRISTNGTTLYQLADDSEWNYVIPFIQTNIIQRIIQKFIEKNPSSIIKFPQIGDDRKSLLFTPTLYALEYYTLLIFPKNQELLQLVLNLIIISHSFCKNFDPITKICETDIKINAVNLKDLIGKLKNISFLQFLKTQISFADIENKKEVDESTTIVFKTIIDLIKDLDGEIGNEALLKLDITLNNDENSSRRNDILHKKAKDLKSKIMQEYRNKQQSYISNIQESNFPNTEKNEECYVCHLESSDPDDFLVYPCLAYRSVIPSIIFRNFFEKTISIKMCLHPIHSKCISTIASQDNSSSKYICPTDRCPRNCFLPIITTEYNKITSKQLLNGISTFINDAYGNTTFIVDIARSYAAEIEILELRHRSNPSCLDSKATQIMLHQIYLALWHTRSSEADYILDNDDETITPLMKYILFLISVGEKIKAISVINLVSICGKELNNQEFVRYLRCCAIFDHFGKGDKIDNSDLIDWDRIFSVDFLKEHYQIKRQLTDCCFKPFTFTNLPTNFLSFNEIVDITNISKGIIAICLFTKTIVSLSTSGDKNIPLITTFLKSHMKKSFSAFLMLTGPKAGSVEIADLQTNNLITIKGFYVDPFGEEDPGFQRGSILKLSTPHLVSTIEEILSGNWTNNNVTHDV